MTEDLQESLAQNAREWLALSQTIATAEKVSFERVHKSLFATYGSNFMSHVYRTAFEQLLQNTPPAERDQLLNAIQLAMDEAIEKQYYLQPTAAQCAACHSRT